MPMDRSRARPARCGWMASATSCAHRRGRPTTARASCRWAMAVADPRDRRARGALVEAAACRHLLAAGLRQLAANAGFRGGELDLVMLDGDTRHGGSVVFVEVRYRSHAGF